jgi:hypothetical protein
MDGSLQPKHAIVMIQYAAIIIPQINPQRPYVSLNLVKTAVYPIAYGTPLMV